MACKPKVPTKTPAKKLPAKGKSPFKDKGR